MTKLHAIITVMLEQLRKSYEEFNNVMVVDAYISHRQGVQLVQKVVAVKPNTFSDYIKILPDVGLLIIALKLRKLVKTFEDRRVEHNLLFVENEKIKRADFFNNIGGKSLDAQQLQAVIPDEDNVLIIAGAGSGKTLTIEAKVKYLIDCLGVNADSILPISFTKKSATSMKERINVPGVDPQTFHKFGLTALQTVEHRMPNIFDESKIDQLFRSFIKDLSLDSSYLAALTNFFMNYIKIPKSEFEFETLGDYIQYLKDQNFTTYKKIDMPYQGKTTYRNETVKSIQECVIANFLLFNRVDYEYEAQYDFPISQFGRKKKYNPDFTIHIGEKKIYLEHFGIDRNNNVPAFFASPNETYEQARRKYVNGIDWKRKTHQGNGTILIETYSYEFGEGNFLQNLETRLREAGVPLNPMSEQEVWGVIQDSGKDEVDGFVSLVVTFLSLMKSNSYDIKELRAINKEKNTDTFLFERTENFLMLFEPLYSLYENHLHETGQIDFNDMITTATEYIEDGDYYCPLSYVIVDEFQDLSVGRYKILAAIRKQNPDVKFYCVGDDWQSIYRFAGSDISLFRDFEQYFGYTIRQKIETTYRFNQPLIDLSSDFILKNPNQTIKSLKAPQERGPTTYSIIESDSAFGDDTDSLVRALNELIDKGLNPEQEVYLIGRYNFDFKRIMNQNKEFRVNFSDMTLIYTIERGQYRGKEIKVEFFTAHRSKGLEADYTIVMNCNSGKYGFPSGKADDPLLNLLLSSADQFENGEERRLFYVAITRTKKHVTLLTDKTRKSKFIKELQDETDDRELRCPKCEKGDLLLRSGKGYKFYGCSNFAYGCDYSRSYKPDDELDRSASAVQENANKPHDANESLKTDDIGAASVQVTPRKTLDSSNLNTSELNKLTSFVNRPDLYVGSEKAREKVAFLRGVESKMSMEEKAQFAKALAIWTGRITK